MDSFLAVIDDIVLYNNHSFLIPLYLISLIVLWIIEDDKTVKNILVYLSTALILIFTCPIFAFLGKKIDDEIYYRVWWTIPMGLTFCYLLTKVAFKMKNIWKKLIVFYLAIMIIVLNGKLVYTNSYRFDLENKYCVPQATVDLANYFTLECEAPLIIAPPEIMMYIRQYNSNISVPFSRYYFSGLKFQEQELFDAINNLEEYDIDVITNAAAEHQILYIALNALVPLSGDMEEKGFSFQTWLDGYNIYRYDQLYNDYIEYGVIKK